MKAICVFLSAYVSDPVYADPTVEFAKLLVKNNYEFVWGGSDRGLMKVLCSAVQEAGGRLYGVTMEAYKDSRKLDADEMIIAPNVQERKRILLEKSDAFVIMPGGIGTLDEVTEVIELKKQGVHEKPIVFLNTNNFYNGLREQLLKMEKEKFIPISISELAYFADKPDEAIEHINHKLQREAARQIPSRDTSAEALA